MMRSLVSTLTIAVIPAVILAMTAGGGAPVDAAEKRAKAQSGTQKSKGHPNTIDVLSFSWGMSPSSPKKKGLRADTPRPASKAGKAQ